LPVLGRNGEIIRGARLERNGISYRRNNPIRTMVARSQNKESPLLSKRSADAADRLAAAWEMAGKGVTFGVSSYEPRTASSPQTGSISDGTPRIVNQQIQAHREIEGIKTVLGARWGAAFSIIIVGIDVSSWAGMVGMREEPAAGFIACVMDTIADYYAGPEKRGQIRTVKIGPARALAAE
jgi:hypothetical protein